MPPVGKPRKIPVPVEVPLSDSPEDLASALAAVDQDAKHLEDDFAAEPLKPKARPVARKPNAVPGRTLGWKTQVEQGLTQNMVLLGMVIGSRCEFCGTHIINSTDRFVQAAIRAGEHSTRIRAALVTITSGSVYAEFAFAGLALAAPLAMHHGILPPNRNLMMAFGAVANETNGTGPVAHEAPMPPTPPSDEVKRHIKRRVAKSDDGSN